MRQSEPTVKTNLNLNHCGPTARPKRRFLRVSLRTLLLLLTAGCIWIGWKVDKAHKQRAAVAWVKETGGEAYYDYERNTDHPMPPGPAWLRELIGIDLLSDVTLVFVGDASARSNSVSDVTPLADLKNLQSLHLARNQISDLRPLANLRNLTFLLLAEQPVSDLTPLANLKCLEELYLYGTHVSDVTPLADLKNLKILDLDDTQVSDLAPLASLNGLEWLFLNNTQVSDLTPVAKMESLQVLELESTRVHDLSPLARLTRLDDLTLNNTTVTDLTPLASVKSLKVLNFINIHAQVSEEQLRKLKQALPDCVFDKPPP